MFDKVRRVLAGLIVFLLTGVCPALAETSLENKTGRGSDYSGGPGRAVMGRVFGLKDQGGDIQYYAFDLSERNRANSVTRSLLVPGWGQAFNKEPVKGGAFFIVTSAALIGSVAMNEKADDSYKSHKNSGLSSNDDYDDYKREKDIAVVLGSLAGVLWIIGIVDAYKHAYDPLYQTRLPVDVQVRRGEARIQWDQKF